MALNSNARVVRVISRGMYVVPIVLGVCDVYGAPPELRMRTLFEEGFGIVGGVTGAFIGGQVVGSMVATMLCLGPFGFFVAIFLGAAIGGIYLANKFKRSGSLLYSDFDARFESNQVYYSVEQMIKSF